MQKTTIKLVKGSKPVLDEVLAEYSKILRAVESAVSVASSVEKLCWTTRILAILKMRNEEWDWTMENGERGIGNP